MKRKEHLKKHYEYQQKYCDVCDQYCKNYYVHIRSDKHKYNERMKNNVLKHIIIE